MALTATPRRLVQVLLTPTVGNRFNNTTGQKQVIKEFCFCNQTSSKQTISVAIVPTGETLGAKHYLIKDVEIAANETLWFTEIANVMELNDSLYAGASGDVSMYVSAAEFTTVV